MAWIRCYAMGAVAVWVTAAGIAGAADSKPVLLRESHDSASTSRVQVGLKGEGLFLQAAPPGATKAQVPKPLTLKVEVRLEYLDRVIKLADSGRPSRSARRIIRAGSAINGEVRTFATAIRPSVAIVIAESKPDGILLFSPGGPFSQSELEMLEVPADPLVLGDLLSDKPVATGDRWTVGNAAAMALSSYDTVQKNALEASLESLDDAKAVVKLTGEVNGSRLAGDGTIKVEGSFTLDRKVGRIVKLTVERAETRRPGLVEEGLDVKSTLTLTKTAAETPVELKDDTLQRIGTEANARNQAILFTSPDGKYTLVHDRAWHLYWDSPKLTVFKRVEGGRLVAQCNVTPGPNAGKGKHQDPNQFRDDIKKSLGSRFVQMIGVGEVEGDPSGGYRYKVGVQGRQENVGVVWYYYLIANTEGEQILATFTLADNQTAAFGAQDEVMIGTFRWKDGDGG